MLEVLPESHAEHEKHVREPETLNELFAVLAQQYGDNPALISSHGESISFQQLQKQIRNSRQALINAGIKPRERIAVVLPQGMEILLSFLSISSFGVFVPLNPEYTESEFSYFLEVTGVDSILIGEEAASGIELAVQKAGLRVIRVAGYSLEGLKFTGLGESLSEKNYVKPRSSDIALLLSTSGTTSQPKLVPLSHKNLLVAARNLQSSLQLNANDCCLNMLPPFHIGALLDLLLAPLAANAKVVVAEDFKPETIFSALLEHELSWIQAVPTMLHALLSHQSNQTERFFASKEKNNLRFIRSVSAPLSAELKNKIEEKFTVPVIEIYGMTETTGVICSNPLQASKPGSVGVPVKQSVCIRDSQGNVAKQGLAGEVLVQGDNVFAGYEGVGEQVKQESFFSGWFRTGDEGYFDEEGYLFLTGRIKEIINRGGEKISPREIDKLALAFPHVIEAACFAIEHESLGEDIALALVSDKGFDEAAFKKYLSQELAHFKVPRQLVYLYEIPKNKNGKILRYRLAEEYGNFKPARQTKWQEPTQEPALSLSKTWQKLLNVKKVGLQDNFFDLGGDSLSALGLLEDVKKSYQVDVHATALFENPTLHEFSEYLVNHLNKNKVKATPTVKIEGLPEKINTALVSLLAAWQGERQDTNSLVVGLNTLGEKPPLFWCVQGYEELALLSQALGENQPVYGMRSLASIPGKNLSHTQPVAKHYALELNELLPEGDFYLGGFCEGASFMFEVALELQNRNRHVALLCLHDRFVAQKYTGRTVFFFCQDSFDNPYCIFPEPEKGWFQFYKGPVSYHKCRMTHSYLDDKFNEFVSALSHELEAAAEGKSSNHKIELQEIATEELKESAYNAKIEIISSRPKMLSPGERTSIEVCIKNISDQDWQPSSKSGIALAGRWYNRKGAPRSYVKEKREFTETLAPGDSITLQLAIQAPPKNGLRVLEIDLIDEGVTWFKERGSESVKIPLSVFRGAHLLRRLLPRN